jgi:hypothetical protein
MDIDIKTDEFRKAMDQYVKLSGKSVPAAINKQFPKVFQRVSKTAPRAMARDVNRFAKSPAAVRVALARTRGKGGGRPQREVVADYIERMVKAKKAALGFMRLVIADMGKALAGKGTTSSAQFRARRASETYHNAWVRYTHTFKSNNNRKSHVRILEDSLSRGMDYAVNDMGDYIKRKLEEAGRKAGVK